VRAKSAFLANVSHEIRPPLGAVLGLASVLRGMPIDRAASSLVDDIHGAGTTLLRLVDDLLDEARMEAGKLLFVAAPFDLREVARLVVEPLQVKAAARGVRLLLDIPNGTHTDVLGDRVRVGQIIGNLVSNAVKFTDLGSIHVRIRTEDAGVSISVADTGIGIAPAQLQRIFEPFTQVDESTTRRFGGAGLGLTITRRLIDAMGGTLEVESESGRGSRFTVTLPLEPVASAPSQQAPTELPQALSRHILVVEDNEVGQRAVRMMLEQLGHRVQVVDDGIAAVLAAERTRYDLVLMDCHLPGLDGFEATRRIRALPGRSGQVPIVACTASVLAEDRARCLAVGMNDIVTKPLSHAELRRVTESLRTRNESSLPPPAPAPVIEVLDASRLSALRNLGGTMLGQLLAAYCEHAPGHLATIEAAGVNNDALTLRRAAHALHGMSLNVGAAAVARACADVERAAAAGRVTASDAIRAAYQQTLVALAAARDAHP
jgi:CheY-like chemotaxis protein/anti-sigma regulatory factor (Ser/Thr protein kinase)